jgi:hypothetical protein
MEAPAPLPPADAALRGAAAETAPPRRVGLRVVITGLLLCAVVAVGVVARRPLLRLLSGGDVQRARAGALTVPIPEVPPAGTAAPPATAGPELGASVGGSWDGWRVRLEHARRRNAAGEIGFLLTAERFDDSAWRFASIEQVRASVAYYADHRPVAHAQRLAKPLEQYAFSLQLARDGKYHAEVRLDTGWGPISFVCDVCLGGSGARCPGMRSACVPTRSSHSH